MANDLERLKARLWTQFNEACDMAEDIRYSESSRTPNREAAGTLGLAIAAVEREQRERESDSKAFRLVGKPEPKPGRNDA